VVKWIAVILVLALVGQHRGRAQQVIRIWPQSGVGSEKDAPTLTVYPPGIGTATGAAIIICPGGAYRGLARHEGEDYALFFASHGIAAYVLRYRLGPVYGHEEITADAMRAVRMVRSNAKEWGINKKMIGIIGSSAGGHLASTVMTHFDNGDSSSSDPIERVSSRPDFGILCYPVISMGPISHEISREMLLGKNPSPALVKRYSSELQVTAETPPCFLWHTAEDKAVSVENSLEFAKALQKNGVPFDLHIYEKGRHGLGIGDKPPFANALPWTRDLLVWLRGRGAVRQE
jgi:acetyl esterase/lipase